MAGDWLKVETITPDKPEVHAIAGRLTMTAEEAFGRLFRVWVWLQNVTINGHVRVRDLSVVDQYAGRKGFGQAMAEEGWINATNDGFIVPKWDRHLSKGAKKRALDLERKRRERGETVPEKSRAKEDKIRLEKREESLSSSTKKKERAPTKTPVCRWPEGFGVDEAIRLWNSEKGFPEGHLELHLEIFREAVDKGDLMYAGERGWRAAFQKCIREDWGGLRSAKGRVSDRQQVSFLDELTGRGRVGHVIDGTAERSD
jgi:hypothetical protein